MQYSFGFTLAGAEGGCGAPQWRTGRLLLSLTAVCVFASFSARSAHAQPDLYRLQSGVTVPGPVEGWDYLSFDSTRSYLFINQRQQGVLVYNMKDRKPVARIADSQGSNSTTLVPDLDLGFTSNGDGTTTMFRLSTLKTLKRVRFGRSADAGFYEPVTKQMVFAMGDDHAIAFVDAKTGRKTATLKMDSEKLEAAVADGTGNIFMNERDRDRVVRIDARRHTVTAQWPTVGCDQPTGMAFDARNQRIFSGCRGAKPVLLIMNAKSGKVVAAPEIGRGNDTVIFDAARHRILTSNGIDANIVVIDQVDADHYALGQATTTRPEARTMAFDPATQRLFLVAAEGAVDPARHMNRAVAPFYPNVYFPDTFKIFTYALH